MSPIPLLIGAGVVFLLARGKPRKKKAAAPPVAPPREVDWQAIYENAVQNIRDIDELRAISDQLEAAGYPELAGNLRSIIASIQAHPSAESPTTPGGPRPPSPEEPGAVVVVPPEGEPTEPGAAPPYVIKPPTRPAEGLPSDIIPPGTEGTTPPFVPPEVWPPSPAPSPAPAPPVVSPPVIPSPPVAPPTPAPPIVAPPVVPAPPVSPPESTPVPKAQIPADTLELTRYLLEKEGSANWKRVEPRVQIWQETRGLTADGKFGPGTARRLAEEIGTLPLVRYWPQGTLPGTAVPQYQADILRIAAEAEEPRASQLRASADREKGQGFGTSPAAASERVLLEEVTITPGETVV